MIVLPFVIILFTAIVLQIVYSRYFPVHGVRCEKVEIEHTNKIMLDIRDYNVSDKDKMKGTVMIPVAYLKRFFHEIPNGDIHIIASSQLEKNMGIRILKKKGFRVTGYTIENCPCGQEIA